MYNSVYYLTFYIFISILVFTSLSVATFENPHVTLLGAKFFTNDKIVNISENCHQIPTTFKEITFSCVSAYPTEWKFTDAPHKDVHLKDIKISKRRYFTDIDDESTYNFESNLTLRFKDPSRLQDITCRGAKKQGLQRRNTSIVVKTVKSCHIDFCIKSEVDTEEIYKYRNREGFNDGCKIQLQVDEKNQKFNCNYSAEYYMDDGFSPSPLMTKLIKCSTPDECHAIFKSDHEICNDSSVVFNCSHERCKSLNPSMEPGVIVCSNGNTSVARRYFVTNSLGLEENLTLHFEKYSNNTDTKWMAVTPLSNTIYARLNFTLYCTATSWRFSYGFVWAIKFNGEKQETEYRQGEEEMDEATFTYINSINLQLNESGNYEVSCIGPEWNSWVWINSTINIKVEEPKAPENTTVEEVIEEGNKTLVCKANGDPPPTYEWIFQTPTGVLKFGPEQENPYYSVHKETDNYSKITILPSSEVKWKKFTCNASNIFGYANATYDIHEIDQSRNNRLIIYAVVGTLTLLGFCGACLIIRKQRNQLKELSDDDILEFQVGNPESDNAMLLPYNVAYEISPEKVFIGGIILGEGQFAQVLMGKVNSEVVAIKTLKPSADVFYFKALLSELKILCYVGQHPNIVNLIGACTKNIRKKEVYIIMEYCSNGSMLKLLRKSRETFINRLKNDDDYQINRGSVINYENASVKHLSTRDLVKWACDIASGMEFLREKNVIHGDLAARNILISENMQAKVGDFGLAKQLFEYSIYIQKLNCPLPLKWMALESLQDLEFSLDSDIWSYGVTMWELFSLGQSPYPGIPQWDFDSYKVLKEGYRMEKPDFANSSIYELMLQCWNSNPKERPSFEYLRLHIQEELSRL